MFRTEDLKSLTALLPGFIAIPFHCTYNILFLDVVYSAKALSQAVDVEHDEVGYESDYYDYVYECSHGELVVDAPKRLKTCQYENGLCSFLACLDVYFVVQDPTL